MKRSVSAALVLMLSAVPVAGAVVAAENVSDAEPAFVRGQQSSGDTSSSSSSSSRSDAMSLLYQQISQLRDEVMTLRSMVEEQAYQIRQMRQRAEERYRDLDSRVSALYQQGTDGSQAGTDGQSTSGSQPSGSGQQADGSNAAAVDQSTGAGAGQSPDSSAGSGSSDGAGASGGSGGTSDLPDPSQVSEQQLYQDALDRLLQDQAYEQSIEGFDLYLENYPDGEFVTNAHYWKGQAYVNLSQLEDARAEFATIVNEYPDGRKIDDAMYSLGTVLHQQGNEERARELLEQVMSRFPNTSAANLADIYLRSL